MKIHLKKIFSLSLLGIISCNSLCNEPSHQHAYPISVPNIVDGTPFGIDGRQIKKLIFIIRKVEELVYGILDKQKVRTGKYIFLNQPHSVSSLADLELEYPGMSTAEKQELLDLLKHVIEDFIKIASPFIEQAHGVKSITLGFMKEWSEKHNREDSPLLDWARQKDGHEFDNFRDNVNSFETLHSFCKDLLSFLSDLIKSCPRGWQQFMELQEKNKK